MALPAEPHSRSPAARDAIAIWQAGVDAVNSQRLVEQTLHRDGMQLRIGHQELSLDAIERIVVVGAGKAGAGMAQGVEAALGSDIVRAKVIGWINVPADCVRPLQQIVLHPARPAAVNEPTQAGVEGAERILQLAQGLTANDLCLVLISGGGSALLPAPVEGITLDDKLAVTRQLSRAGATIQELNAVRTRLSRIKGGGLLRAIPAGRVFVLIISDVVGDPLDVIASGPTVLPAGNLDPLAVLRRFVSQRADISETVWKILESPQGEVPPPRVTATNLVIGNNATALNAARIKAESLGYTVQILGTNQVGIAGDAGRSLAEISLKTAKGLRAGAAPVCLLSGGEPTVRLAQTDQPRKGGRNQELALSAGVRLWDEDLSRIAILSGGTDGEDGPTDAAGAWFDAEVRQRALELGLDPRSFLAINNSYPFFEQTGGLLLTGPTHTNVMDVRVALVYPPIE